MAENELPVVHSPAAMMGATVPITLGGGLALMLAEALSGLVAHQLKRAGSPFVLGAGLHHLDMKTMQIAHPSREFELTKSVIAQMGQWYGMPTWGYAGNSDSKVVDGQAALEAVFSFLVAQLSGSNLVHDVGYIESALSTCFAMIVLTDELIAMSDRFVRGVDVDAGSLLLDEIDRVGPGGNFLSIEEALARFREFWYPSLLDRHIREEWQERGATTLSERLNIRVNEIIDEHRPEPLDSGTREALYASLEKAGVEVPR